LLDVHAPALAAAVEAQHDAIESGLTELSRLGQQLTTVSHPGRDTVAHRLYLHLSRFTGEYLDHQLLEELQVMPTLCAAVPTSELESLHAALRQSVAPRVMADVMAVVMVAHESRAIVKAIIETVLLSDAEKKLACELAAEAGADFVKTSTGFAGGGATIHDVELMRKAVGPQMGVKASGGVKTYEDAASMIKAGATRIGASAGVKIIQGPSGSSSGNSSSSSSTKSY